MKAHKTISVDPIIWETFQKISPRGASAYIEDMLSLACNMATSCEDSQISELQKELIDKTKAVEELTESIGRIKIKISKWQKGKQEEKLMIKKQKEIETEEKSRMNRSIKASGILGKLAEDLERGMSR